MDVAPSPDKFKRIARSPYLFALNYLKIQNQDDLIVPFKMNAIQINYLKNRTPRDLILKPRQIGFSTAIQAEIFRYSVTRPTRSLTLANVDENTKKLRLMQKKFYDNLPDGFKPVRSTDNATLTEYPEYNSELMSGTAGNLNVGRAGSYRIQHYSEIAFYRDAGSIMKAALQGGRPMWVVAESTANGATGWFFERCMEALRDPQKSVWKLHFYTWFDFPEYRLELEPGEILDYSDEEYALVHKHNLTPEQIKWRRFKIAETDSRSFQQEYPEDPVSCFLRSGAGFFATIPHLDAVFSAPVAASCDDTHNIVAGLDLGQSEDYTALSIMDADTGHELRLHRVNKLAWSDIWRRVGQWCAVANVRTLVIETNTLGGIDLNDVVRQLRSAGYDGGLARFTTTAKSKPPLIAGLYTALDKQLVRLLPDEVGKHELYDFTSTQTASGAWKYEAATGHDDTVIARALAWYGVNRPQLRILFV